MNRCGCGAELVQEESIKSGQCLECYYANGPVVSSPKLDGEEIETIPDQPFPHFPHFPHGDDVIEGEVIDGEIDDYLDSIERASTQARMDKATEARMKMLSEGFEKHFGAKMVMVN